MMADKGIGSRNAFLDLILKERQRQIDKWGEAQKSELYPAILGEEFGEVCQAALEDRVNIRTELVQVAAVCMAWFEQEYDHYLKELK